MTKKKQKPDNMACEPDNDDKHTDNIDGVTVKILRDLGGILPGLDNLVNSLRQSEAFQERLKATDAEVEHQLKKVMCINEKKEVTRKNIIPQKTALKTAHTTLPREAVAPSLRKKVPVDIFDEGANLKVIAEFPGIEEKDIKTTVHNKLLILSVQAPGWNTYQEVTLPCQASNILNLTYKNGILQIIIGKNGE